MDARSPTTAQRLKELLRGRLSLAAALSGLLLLTLLSALPGNPAGPLDARTGAPVPGFRLEFPASGALLEPFFSLAHALAGAPDYRAASVATLAWLLLCAGMWGALRRKRDEGGPAWRVLLAGLASAGAAAGLFGSYMLLCLLSRLPGWRLVPETHDFIVADLQTHTFASHDGLVSLEENLSQHAGAGYDLVAITEHNGTWDSAELEEKAADVAEPEGRPLATIPGAEVREAQGGYLLGLGIGLSDGDIDLHGLRDAAKFAAYVRESGGEERPDGGAVLALHWKLRRGDVERLLKAGVDGFEIANFGHPAIPEDVRAELLDPRHGGLVLVASSDWHGFGGFWRTWTAFRSPGARHLPHDDRAELVLDALRMRRAADILPLTAGRLGRPSPVRAALAPFAEALRYCRELSGWRVLSWWLWAAALFAAATSLHRAALRPVPLLGSGVLLAMGCGLLASGARLLAAWGSGTTSTAFPGRIGAWAAGLGLVLSVAAAALFYFEARRRGEPAAEEAAPQT